MTTDVTQILEAVLGLIAILLTTLLVPWLRSKVGEARFRQLQLIAGIAVSAAEQLHWLSSDKLDYALEHAQKALHASGLSFDEQIVRSAIEAAVHDLNRLQLTQHQ